MNKHAKQSINVKALDPKTETAAKKDPGASPEMSIAGAIDTLADIAKRSTNLFRIYTEQLRSDDGYQVMDPRTVASTFQDFFQKAAVDQGSLIKQQCELWADLGLLWQRTATRMLSNTPVEPVIEPAKQDKRFRNELWVQNPFFDHAKQWYLLWSRFFLVVRSRRRRHRSAHPAQDRILHTPVRQCVVTQQLCHDQSDRA